jgi:hypothetical protein
MQFRTTKKLIIDEQKLSVLIRLGCPDDRLLSVIKTGKFEKTGDEIIDEILECFVDRKEFKNWGGNHNPKGINNCKKRKKLGQVDNQVDIQVDNQDDGQDVDKDIDIDNKYKYNGNIIKLNEKDYNNWLKKYPDLDLKYNLDKIDLWFAEKIKEKPEYKARWFFMAQQMLLKNQKEVQNKNTYMGRG